MRKIISLLLVISMVFSMSIPAFGDSSGDPPDAPAGYVTISIDANTLGAGFLYEPAKVPFYAGENYAAVTDRFLGGNANYTKTGSITSGFYLSGVKLQTAIVPNVPQIVMGALGNLGSGASAEGQFLRDFDYASTSGWMYTVGHALPNVGVAQKIPQDGEVCRWQFTLYGYGADLGVGSGWGAPLLYSAADKDALTAKVAEINSALDKAQLLAKPGAQAAYDSAYSLLSNLTAEQAQLDGALVALDTALNAQPPASNVDIDTQLNNTLAYMATNTPAPNFGTGAGEWTVLALARAGYAVPEGYFEGYYSRIENLVSDASGILPSSSAKKTEYSRLVMALSAIGKDARQVGGYDLTAWLSSMSKVQQQGLNGPVFALIALNTNQYEIPDIDAAAAVTGYTGSTADQATPEKLIDYILEKELKTNALGLNALGTDGKGLGGWALSSSNPDPDMTAMALQALAPYRSDPTIGAAISRGVEVLSALQNQNGGYSSWGSVNAESIAQVIVALTALGIDPATDSRFVKTSGNAVTALLQFYVDGGGFSHTLGTGVNGMATDQSGYALVAYDRFVKGKNSLYDMRDAFSGNGNGTQEPSGEASLILDAPDQVIGRADTAFNALVKTSGFPDGHYKLMDGVINIPDEFSVESVEPSNRLSGGMLSWHYDAADRKLRFVYANTDLNDISVSGDAFPATILAIGLKVKEDVDTSLTPGANISIGGASLKTTSDAPAFVFDVSNAFKTIGFSGISEIALSVRDLFTGDGIDLISDGKRAVAVAASGLPAGTKLIYKGSELFYSPEMTAKHGLETYVLFTTPEEPMADLIDFANYIAETENALTVKFGDTDSNSIINAQDALDAIAAWLRKTAVNTDERILRLNVTSDARINTFDALAIMVNYVSHSEFAILCK
jgi:hypothetical protein